MRKTKKQKQAENDEGARSFTRLLETIDSGMCAVHLAQKHHRLLCLLRGMAQETGRDVSGGISLQLKLTVDPNGAVDVLYGIATKEPTEKFGRSVFFMTDGGNLTEKNPRQLELGVREVTDVGHDDEDAEEADDRTGRAGAEEA